MLYTLHVFIVSTRVLYSILFLMLNRWGVIQKQPEDSTYTDDLLLPVDPATKSRNARDTSRAHQITLEISLFFYFLKIKQARR